MNTAFDRYGLDMFGVDAADCNKKLISLYKAGDSLTTIHFSIKELWKKCERVSDGYAQASKLSELEEKIALILSETWHYNLKIENGLLRK